MLKEACNKTLPAPECLLSNSTVSWDSTKSFMKVIQEIYFISVLVFTTPITCVGLITSLLCTLIFTFYSLTQRTTRRLLIINSVVDTLYLAALSLSRPVGTVLPLGRNLVLCNYILSGASNYLGLFRNWTIVLIACERYMLICHPLHFKSNESIRWTTWAVAYMVFGTIIIRMPTCLTIIFHNLGKCIEAAVFFSIDAFSDILFFTIMPLCLLTFFTVRILKQTNGLRHWRKTRSVLDSERNMAFDKMNKRVHRTIMTVLISFGIATIPFLPNGIIRMLIALGNDSCLVDLARHITTSIAYIGTLLNSTLNCFIYLATWPKFRSSLWRMLTAPFGCNLRRNLKRFSPVGRSTAMNYHPRAQPQTLAEYKSESG